MACGSTSLNTETRTKNTALGMPRGRRKREEKNQFLDAEDGQCQNGLWI